MTKTHHVLVALLLIVAGAFGVPALATAETHEVKMLNKDPDDPKKRNVFIPALIKIKPGDSVRFVSTNKGHNSESIKGMIPEGTEKWKSKISKHFTITFEKPGVYGYKCTPHFLLGMVGLVIVEGEGWDANLEAAKAVKQRGKAKKEFEALWAQLDASS